MRLDCEEGDGATRPESLVDGGLGSAAEAAARRDQLSAELGVPPFEDGVGVFLGYTAF